MSKCKNIDCGYMDRNGCGCFAPEDMLEYCKKHQPAENDLEMMLDSISGLVQGHIDGKQAVWVDQGQLKDLLAEIIKRLPEEK
jgi:hypothetical protein